MYHIGAQDAICKVSLICQHPKNNRAYLNSNQSLSLLSGDPIGSVVFPACVHKDQEGDNLSGLLPTEIDIYILNKNSGLFTAVVEYKSVFLRWKRTKKNTWKKNGIEIVSAYT